MSTTRGPVFYYWLPGGQLSPLLTRQLRQCLSRLKSAANGQCSLCKPYLSNQ